MNPLKWFNIWRRFVGWWRTLFVALGTGHIVDWFKKINDLTSIANDALDEGGYSPTPNFPDTPATPTELTDTPDSPVPAPEPSPPTPNRGGRLRRLIDRLRRRKPEPEPEPTPPSPAPDDGGYKVW